MEGGWGGKRKRKRLPDRGEPRGEAREEQVRAVVRACERAEREAEGVLHPLLDLGGWVSGVGVPAWSWRALRPGEWREGEGGPLVKRRKLEPTGGTSRDERRWRLAEAAGTGGTLGKLAVGRGGGERRRLEEGADNTGVT